MVGFGHPAGARGALLSGSVIDGRYRIDALLGEGGMGIVYRAFHVGLERPIALKTLTGSHQPSDEELKRFKREALAASRIGNDHIIDVTDIGELPDGSPYYVMELLEGHDLEHVLDAGPMPLGQAVHVVCQVCDALHDAHGASIVHRDIKPSNVMLVKKKRDPLFVKVLDFGIAKFNDPNATQLTEGGRGLGTPLYMAPEQLKGLEIEPRTDLYAVGAVLFQALTGARPFNGETLHQLGVAICDGPRPDPRDYNPNIPDDLAAAVVKALSVLPEDRFPSCEALREAIAPYADPNLEVATPPVGFVPGPRRPIAHRTDPVSVRTSRPASKSVSRWTLLAAGVGVVSVGAYLAFMPSSQTVVVAGNAEEGPPPQASAQALLEVSPDGVQVSVDGQPVPTAAGKIQLAGAPGKAFAIRLQHAGQTRTETVTLVRDGELSPKRVALEAAPSSGVTPVSIPVHVEPPSVVSDPPEPPKERAAVTTAPSRPRPVSKPAAPPKKPSVGAVTAATPAEKSEPKPEPPPVKVAPVQPAPPSGVGPANEWR